MLDLFIELAYAARKQGDGLIGQHGIFFVQMQKQARFNAPAHRVG